MFKSKLKKRVEELERELKFSQSDAAHYRGVNRQLEGERDKWIESHNKIKKEFEAAKVIKREQTEADMLLAAFKVILAVATDKPKEEVKQEFDLLDAQMQQLAGMAQSPYRAGGLGTLLGGVWG